MSETAQLIIALSGLFSAVLAGIAAILAGIGAIYAAAANKKGDESLKVTTEVSKELVVVKDNVEKIEVATNSMKDALVKSTGDASFLEGEKQGLAAGKLAKKPDEVQDVNIVDQDKPVHVTDKKQVGK